MSGIRAHVLPALACAALLGLVPAAAAEVYLVDSANGPGTDFMMLQDAVNAAVDGDVILVRGGQVHFPAEVVNESLTIVGLPDEFGNKPAIYRLTVRDLQAGKSFVMRDTTVVRVQSPIPFFDVIDCEGAVLIEDCAIDGGFNSSPPLIPQATIHNAHHVVFTRCALRGTRGYGNPVGGGTPQPSAPGGPGITLEDATVTVYDSQVLGGDGQDADFLLGSPLLGVLSSVGGQGAQVWSGTLNLVGTTVQGGMGGDAIELPGLPCLPASNGGAGLRTFGALRLLDTTITGGAPGEPLSCSAPPSAGPGLVVLPGGSVMTIPESARGLELSSPLENGGTCSVALQGAPGELMTLLLSFTPSATWHVGLKGALAGQPPFVTALLGPLDGDGELAFDVPLAADLLPAALDSLSFTAQALAGASSGGGLLSSPSAVLLLHDVPANP